MPDKFIRMINVSITANLRTMTSTRLIEKTILIQASPARIWQCLTEPELLRSWMADFHLEIVSDWKPGSQLFFWGVVNGHPFENKCRILEMVPGKRLAYSHLSSLSNLPDVPENYTTIHFGITETQDGCLLELRQSNMVTDSIYGHFNFYWVTALPELKKIAENQPAV